LARFGRACHARCPSSNAKREIKLAISAQIEQQNQRRYSDNVKLDLFPE
jgi:hypothetical protein